VEAARSQQFIARGQHHDYQRKSGNAKIKSRRRDIDHVCGLDSLSRAEFATRDVEIPVALQASNLFALNEQLNSVV
jgi:hypothetical protein